MGNVTVVSRTKAYLSSNYYTPVLSRIASIAMSSEKNETNYTLTHVGAWSLDTLQNPYNGSTSKESDNIVLEPHPDTESISVRGSESILHDHRPHTNELASPAGQLNQTPRDMHTLSAEGPATRTVDVHVEPDQNEQ
jgi:hypothetical protein